MNVALLNFHYSKINYGAVLQAAALQNIIKDLGFSPTNINLVPVKKMRFLLIESMKGLAKKNFFPSKVKTDTIDINKIENSEVFEDFRRDWISVTEKKYSNLQDLCCEKWNYDAYVVGSDQVWRPQYTRNNALAYFFSFIPSNALKIAFAASFGTDHWESSERAELTQKAKQLLSGFAAVSVREDSGVEICETVFGRHAEHVIDPTILAGRDFFENMISSRLVQKQLNNIVYYKLDQDDNFNKIIRSLSAKYSKDTENIYYYKKDDGRLLFNDVYSWLAKIRDSYMVVTDSFHCICFSLIFNKPFLYYPPSKNRGLSRVESLFRSIGVYDNKIFSYDCIDDLESFLVWPGDWDSNQLDNLSKRSIDFLFNSLSQGH